MYGKEDGNLSCNEETDGVMNSFPRNVRETLTHQDCEKCAKLLKLSFARDLTCSHNFYGMQELWKMVFMSDMLHMYLEVEKLSQVIHYSSILVFYAILFVI